jgi:hypothetical protein
MGWIAQTFLTIEPTDKDSDEGDHTLLVEAALPTMDILDDRLVPNQHV